MSKSKEPKNRGVCKVHEYPSFTLTLEYKDHLDWKNRSHLTVGFNLPIRCHEQIEITVFRKEFNRTMVRIIPRHLDFEVEDRALKQLQDETTFDRVELVKRLRELGNELNERDDRELKKKCKRQYDRWLRRHG